MKGEFSSAVNILCQGYLLATAQTSAKETIGPRVTEALLQMGYIGQPLLPIDIVMAQETRQASFWLEPFEASIGTVRDRTLFTIAKLEQKLCEENCLSEFPREHPVKRLIAHLETGEINDPLVVAEVYFYTREQSKKFFC